MEKKIQRYAKKVERLTIFVQKEDDRYSWEYQKILALTDASKIGRKAIIIAAGLASAFDSDLSLGIIRPDQEIIPFLKSLEIDELCEFGDHEPHEKDEDDLPLPWTEVLDNNGATDVRVRILPGRDIVEVTRFIERENIDLVVLPAHYGPKEEKVNDSAESESLSLFTRIIVYETPACVFLIRKRISPPKIDEEPEKDMENHESMETPTE